MFEYLNVFDKTKMHISNVEVEICF